MTQPLQSRTRTQPHHPHRFQPVCRFAELGIPDYSILCRYRNWLAQDNTLSELLELINRQLTESKVKRKASAAVIDATIIQTAGSKTASGRRSR